MAEEMTEFRVSNDASDDAEELRRRIAEDGYLFFRKLQDPDQLHELRLEMLAVIRDGGWLQAGTDLADGIADLSKRCAEGDIAYADVYHEVYKLESFHRAGHWPEVLKKMEQITGGPVLPHPQKIARLWFPQYTEHTTPAHQDFVHFQGSYDTYTCWTPVGDCPIELGGLAVVPGSHKQNAVLEHHFSLGAGSLAVDTEQQAGPWATTNYEIGDSLIFHSLLLPQALPTATADRLRVSPDNRYQARGLPVAEHMLQPHLNIFHALTWEEVYAGWQSADLQYYWQDVDMPIIPRDMSYAEKGFAEALELAEQGDERAHLALQRAIERDPDSEQAQAAAAVLAAL